LLNHQRSLRRQETIQVDSVGPEPWPSRILAIPGPELPRILERPKGLSQPIQSGVVFPPDDYTRHRVERVLQGSPAAPSMGDQSRELHLLILDITTKLSAQSKLITEKTRANPAPPPRIPMAEVLMALDRTYGHAASRRRNAGAESESFYQRFWNPMVQFSPCSPPSPP
jgi:hypothetical protein